MTRKLSYVQAFNEAVRQEMAVNDDIFCAGEDIGAFGGVFQSYAGLQAEFGKRRVVDTPISEQAIIGLGVGAAVTGLRPIVDIMFMDFICVAFDQIVNQAAKLKYMFGGAATIPLTITTGGGGGLSAAAQHSQSLEALICHIPGLKVVHPSNPYDMKGLMTACIREDNPTIMIKHKRLLGMSGEVPEEPYEIPLGKANVLREGKDVTVVGWGRMVNEALDAAERLAADGIDVEVIDPRTLQPLDTDDDHRVGQEDQPRRRRPRGGPLRRPRRRGRGPDPGRSLRLPRRSGRPHRRAVLAGAVLPGARSALPPLGRRHPGRHPRRGRPSRDLTDGAR